MVAQGIQRNLARLSLLFIRFLLLILLLKMALAQFSIETTVLSNAVIGALLAANEALILDETPLARSLEHYRRIVAVAIKLKLRLQGAAPRIAAGSCQLHLTDIPADLELIIN